MTIPCGYIYILNDSIGKKSIIINDENNEHVLRHVVIFTSKRLIHARKHYKPIYVSSRCETLNFDSF